MADVNIYGPPQSNFVRVARMACLEKGVDYTLEPAMPHSPEILALNPFGKVPGFRHGDVTMFETSAIARYIDEAFGGPKLQPDDVRTRALMNQWISAVNDYYDTSMIRHVVVQRVLVPTRGGTTDEAMVSAALEKTVTQLKVADETLAANRFLTGDALTLADLFLVPIIFYFGMIPEGKEQLAACANVQRWLKTMTERPSFAATQPPPPKSQAAE